MEIDCDTSIEKEQKMEKVKEPKYLKVLRYVGITLLIVGIVLIVLGAAVFRTEWGMGDTIPNLWLLIPGVMMVFISFSLILMGFMPKIQKMTIQGARYMQDQNKETLSDMASTQADIHSEAITKVTKSVKEGLEDHKYCKYCGAEIDADSKFCQYCGKEQ